jgi:hypothetical protein
MTNTRRDSQRRSKISKSKHQAFGELPPQYFGPPFRGAAIGYCVSSTVHKKFNIAPYVCIYSIDDLKLFTGYEQAVRNRAIIQLLQLDPERDDSFIGDVFILVGKNSSPKRVANALAAVIDSIRNEELDTVIDEEGNHVGELFQSICSKKLSKKV